MAYAILMNNTISAHGSALDLWPSTSFSVDGPNAEFLAEVGAVMIRSDAPYDPATQILQPCEPYLRDGEVFDTLAAPLPPTPAPTPDWPRFKRIALGSDTLKSIAIAAYPSEPIAAGALSASLYEAEKGNIADFAGAWKLVCLAANVTPEVAAGFVSVAEACNLPADFVSALSPE